MCWCQTLCSLFLFCTCWRVHTLVGHQLERPLDMLPSAGCKEPLAVAPIMVHSCPAPAPAGEHGEDFLREPLQPGPPSELWISAECPTLNCQDSPALRRGRWTFSHRDSASESIGRVCFLVQQLPVWPIPPCPSGLLTPLCFVFSHGRGCTRQTGGLGLALRRTLMAARMWACGSRNTLSSCAHRPLVVSLFRTTRSTPASSSVPLPEAVSLRSRGQRRQQARRRRTPSPMPTNNC